VSAPALRPLGIGEILDVGIKIYWRNAWTLFRIVVFVVLPTQVVVSLVQISALPSRVTKNVGANPFSPQFTTTNDTTLTGRETAALVVGFGIAILINALAGKLAQAACFRAVADAYLGGSAEWRPSLRYALRRLPAVVAVSILTTVFIGLGAIACFIPGIYLWGAFYVAIPVVLVEGSGPVRALGRSRRLVKGRWWGTIAVAIVGYLLVFIVGSALTALIVGVAFASPSQSTVTGFVFTTLSTTLGTALTTPAVAAFATVLYIDLRVRKEGFDLMLLAQRLGVDAGPEPAVTSLLPPQPPSYADEEEKPPFWPPPPGWQPSGERRPLPAAGPDEDTPPFWPPPPGWKPSGE
jgi:hypothetical protein